MGEINGFSVVLTNQSNRRLQAVRVDCRVRTKPTQQPPKANSIAGKTNLHQRQ